ncbi:MAG TPA: bifunctional helix-turn-helix domain-containing protein/methylated-DNA--[protein]-cysteine S-methyltransferase [Gemmatimonadaceae bacterium]|nr:bifunctional helix-turn-helix domain-containing protein/methylated-DNA--[protein]-cysteine S-methyltransferase [Gemmatimonadaceae bacterium]
MIAPSDYTRIARAISWLDEHSGAHPALADAATAAGLSSAHFQRLFTKWAGISPKRFLQARTAETALSLLRAGRPVLDAAYATGLSGTSRLHELVLHAEAVTPGEVKTRGTGLEIRYGWHETPFGDALFAMTPRGLCFLAFSAKGGRAEAFSDLRRRWPRALFVADPRATAPVAARAFPGTVSRGGPLALHVRGTNFQLRVWNALLRIPTGSTSSYAAIATEIGEPSAPRAVGNAVGANPISWLIPCHRVLRGNGAIGGYAWGPDRKRTMLVWEGLRKNEKEIEVEE